MITVRVFTLLFALMITSVTHVYAGDMSENYIREAIELRLKKYRFASKVDGKKVLSYDVAQLKSFYSRRRFTPAWTSGGELCAEANDLFLALRAATLEGLNPADYHIDAIESMIGKNPAEGMDDAVVAVTDVLLTDAFLHYASDLHSGRVSPKLVNEEWDVHPRKTDFAIVLHQALDSLGVREALNQLRPRHKGYENLRKALAGYRSLPATNDPPKITGIRRLEKGDSNVRVVALRNRVSLWYPGISLEDKIFDDSLEHAVMVFQKQHGIEPDGIVGKETIAGLNMTNADRMRQIVVNLERYRWLPEQLEEKHIAVNIPNFELSVMEKGIPTKTIRVVVGKSDHRTPLLNNAMTYIVLSPYWNVPYTIATKEILPKMSNDPGYLKKENIRIFRKEGNVMTAVDHSSINWAAVRNRTLRFRMEPGVKNSLGRVKFMFPNFTNIYMHDTPSKRLFAKSIRNFSHGCVRVEQPVALASYLLGKDTAWVNDAIRKASGKGKERVVRLPEPIQVHLQYFTAWVDDAGSLQFRKDIYDWDDQVSKAMRGIPTLHKKSGVEKFASRIAGGSPSASLQ